MGRREAWSAEKSSEPTHWEFRRRNEHRENVKNAEPYDDSANKRVRSADDKRSIRIK